MTRFVTTDCADYADVLSVLIRGIRGLIQYASRQLDSDILESQMSTPPNHTLQRTAVGPSGCGCVAVPPSLSFCR